MDSTATLYHALRTVLYLWALTAAWRCGLVDALGSPLLGPDIMSFESLPPLTLWHPASSPLAPSPPVQSGLPAPKGTDFDGPDPGLNAAIITVPTKPCPSGYRLDLNEVCRLKFGYGPNPFYSFTPENFKGDVQFYMGLQVGGEFPSRRRGRVRGRPRAPLFQDSSNPGQSSDDDDD
ncbi:uncharacterized protein [Procambarus clarkii]|uniref:uncharacterized protein n=1 Tax=Procambarus clarkii TaxID=6728 RepID=UPI001E674E2C|nr:uncharacterized protein LOC123764303 [Procambarus clarkii]